MADCKIEMTFEDGALGVKMQGSSMSLVAGCVTMVRAMYTSLVDAHGGDLAQLMFRAFVEGGLPFDDEHFDERREQCEDGEELERKLKAVKAKKQLADIVELLVNNEGKEETQNG